MEYPQQWDDIILTGSEWMRRFIKKFSFQISLIEQSTRSFNVQVFNNNLKQVPIKYELFPPDKSYDADETGLSTIHMPPRSLTHKTVRQLRSSTIEDMTKCYRHHYRKQRLW